MLLHLAFKSDNEKEEFPKIAPHLRAILWELAWFCKRNFDQQICVTELLRTQSEQDAIYANNQKYQIKPWKSVHQFGRGADIRTYNCFSLEEIQKILQFLNSNWVYDPQRPHLKTAIHHDVGSGAHIHIQVM